MTASTGKPNGLPRLRLAWKTWSRASSSSLAKKLTAMMMATTTRTCEGMNLVWEVTSGTQDVCLRIWLEPANDRSSDGL